MEIVYSTHSTSTDNVAGIASGHSDPDLAPLGVEQASAFRERIAGRGFEVAVAADLRRARRTAEIALAGSGVPLRVDARLRECDYGELNGAPRSEVEAIRASRVGEAFPGGESYADVVVRVRALLDELAGEYPEGEVLLVGHHAPFVALEHIVRGVPIAEALAASAGDYWQPEWVYEYSASGQGAS